MPDTALHVLSILFAIITGTGAGILVLLSRDILRESPFGDAIVSLLTVIWLLTIYHAVLLVTGSETVLLEILRLIAVALLLFSVVSVIKADRKISKQAYDAISLSMKYPKSLLISVAGLFVISIGGPLFDLILPFLHHWLHGFAYLLIFFGLYDSVRENIQKGEWPDTLLRDPTIVRQRANWMRPMDDSILEVFHSSDLILTPAIIALNIDCTREEVNRRLSTLESNDFVEKVERGKYQITSLGEWYLRGMH